MTSYAGHVVTKEYGPDSTPPDYFHRGADLDTPDLGVPLFTPVRMKLTRWEQTAYGWLYDMTGEWRGKELMIRVAHLSRRFFSNLTVVPAGTKVAMTGGVKGAPGAGNSTGSHLHVEFYIDGNRVDPENYPGLLNAIFSEGIEMTEKEIRNMIEFENGQAHLRLSEALMAQVDDISDTTAKHVLRQMSQAHKIVGDKLIADSKD